MPIYEYECLKCSEHFDLRRSMDDSDQELECPKCKAKNPHRVFSTFATTTSGDSCATSSPT